MTKTVLQTARSLPGCYTVKGWSYTKQGTECRPASAAKTSSLNTYALHTKAGTSIYSSRSEVMVFQMLLLQCVNSSS